uniref:PE-PGRS family protein n=1 Tax=Parastrongyloides trichosuri TaxID=131310 RepID=A0A0N4ZZJ1_PARTI
MSGGRSQQILAFQGVDAAVASQDAGIEAEAIHADRRRLQQIVPGDPGADAVGVRLGLQIGQGDVRPVFALLRRDARALAGRPATPGQDVQRFGPLQPGPQGVAAMGVAEGADAAQGELKGPPALGAGQLGGQVVGCALGRLAIEGQGDVQGVQRPPAGAGQAGLPPRQGLGDVLGNGDGGEQT